MSSPPPILESHSDGEHLKLLAIFQYIYAGLLGLGLIFLALHYFIMSSVLEIAEESSHRSVRSEQVEEDQVFPGDDRDRFNPDSSSRQTRPLGRSDRDASEEVSKVFGYLIWIYVLIGLFLVIVMILNIVSARAMGRRRGRTLSMITAGINCLNLPLGTVLGVFTLVVLCRTSVVNSYHAQSLR